MRSLMLGSLAALSMIALCAGPTMASDNATVSAGMQFGVFAQNALPDESGIGPSMSHDGFLGAGVIVRNDMLMHLSSALDPDGSGGFWDDGAGIGMIRVITHDNAFDDMTMIATDSVPALSAFNVATTCLYDENPGPVTQMMIPGLIGWSGASGHPTVSCASGDSVPKLKIGPET